MKRRKTWLFAAVLALLLALCAAAAADVEINTTNFPNLSEYVRTFDLNSDGILSDDEISQVHVIELDYNFGGMVSDLSEFEYFPELTDLSIQNYMFETAIDFSALPKLKRLVLGFDPYNYLVSINIRSNKALESLTVNCSMTSSTLDVSKNTKLTYLNCSGCNLVSLDLSHNKALTTLDCSHSNLTTLDISKNTALTKLYCESTKLTSLNLRNQKSLKWLYCSDTGITNVDISKNPLLCALVHKVTPNEYVWQEFNYGRIYDESVWGKSPYNSGILAVNAWAKVKTNKKTISPLADKPLPSGHLFLEDGYLYLETGNGTSVTLVKPTKRNLKKAKVPDTADSKPVTAIDDYAFKGMSSLTTVSIGRNVKKIGQYAFSNCKKANKITILGTKLSKIGKGAFSGGYKKVVVLCAKIMIKKYRKLMLAAGLSSSAVFRAN